MSDEAFDPCACVWDRNLAVQRLLSLLRQSQTVCTDSECLDGSLLLPERPSAQNETNFMMISLIALFGLLMYVLRPRSLRSSVRDEVKHHNPGPDFGGDPPAPPAIH